MNDALCDMTWSGPQRKNYQMGYICEIEYDAKYRRRRDTEESSCQVEYRTRRGILENIQMSCKEGGTWPFSAKSGSYDEFPFFIKLMN